jgi:hypothetical protein
MSSSTSSFDRDPSRARYWRRWIATFLVTCYGLGSLLFLLLLAIDPYDSGRFPNFGLTGVDDHNPRTSDVSRGRDRTFDSAIFGNSTGMLLDPFRLSSETGLHFTQMTIPALGPREELSLMGWFMWNHPHIGAVVLVADSSWCARDPNMPLAAAFPFWLYGGDASYLANVLNTKSIDRAAWRVGVALGKRKAVDPVGYFDYTEQSKDWAYMQAPPDPIPVTLEQASAPFPWIDALRHQVVDALPPGAEMIIIIPPVYYTLLPKPGTPDAYRIDWCKERLAAVIGSRSRGGFIDFRVNSPEAHQDALFGDRVHYRKPLAQAEESRIIAVLRNRADQRVSIDRSP